MKRKIILNAESKYEILRDISESIRDTLDLDTILKKILDSIYTVIHYDAAGIFVLNQSLIRSRYHRPRQIIAGVASRGYDLIPPEDDVMLRDGKGIIGYVIKSGKSLVAPDVTKDPRYIVGRSQTASEIAVPIISQNTTIGALDIESDTIGAFTEDDLELLGFFADAVSISIEKAMLHIQIMEKKRFEEQMLIAREVQENLLPSENPKIKGYDIAGISKPTFDIGGDYYDYINLEGNKLGVIIADVSGHGIPSALIMTAFRALVKIYAPSAESPAKLMGMLNKHITEFIRKRDFITVFYGILDTADHTFTYTSCGHNPPIFLKRKGAVLKLETGNPSLNLVKGTDFKQEKIEIESGDLLFLYTDGVIEIFNEGGEEYGTDRLEELVVRVKTAAAEDICRKVEADTRNFSGLNYYIDDFTIVVLRRN